MHSFGAARSINLKKMIPALSGHLIACLRAQQSIAGYILDKTPLVVLICDSKKIFWIHKSIESEYQVLCTDAANVLVAQLTVSLLRVELTAARTEICTLIIGTGVASSHIGDRGCRWGIFKLVV